MWPSRCLLPFYLIGQVSVVYSRLEVWKSETIHARRVKIQPRKNIDFNDFPECAKPYCNSTSSLSPSRLGCVESTLTRECLCTVAVTPLACVPSGPSSEENCWYDVEDWFAGQCNNSVPLIPASSMPSCLADCTTNWVRNKGCRTDTRNCFCKLDSNEVINAVERCRGTSCMKHMQPGFDVPFWREQICSQGTADDYDDGAYKTRKKMVKNIQIVVPIFLCIFVLFPMIIGGVVTCHDNPGFGGFFLIAGAVVIATLVLVPIYVAI